MYSLATLDSFKDKILAAAAASAGSSRPEQSKDLTPHSDSWSSLVLGRGNGLAALRNYNPLILKCQNSSGRAKPETPCQRICSSGNLRDKGQALNPRDLLR